MICPYYYDYLAALISSHSSQPSCQVFDFAWAELESGCKVYASPLSFRSSPQLQPGEDTFLLVCLHATLKWNEVEIELFVPNFMFLTCPQDPLRGSTVKDLLRPEMTNVSVPWHLNMLSDSPGDMKVRWVSILSGPFWQLPHIWGSHLYHLYSPYWRCSLNSNNLFRG